MAVSFKFGYEYSIADDTKAAARSKLKLHQKQNKIWWKTIFNMADGIFTPCNVTWSWHWFCQVAAPCNVACSSGIVTLNSPSGSTLQCDTWLWDDMLLNSPGGSTLQWHIALESWHWICQVAAPCSVAGCCGMTCHWIRPAAAPCNVARSSGIMTLNSPGGSTVQCGRWLWDYMPLNSPKRPPYWNSTPDFDFDHITAVDMPFCTSLRNFIRRCSCLEQSATARHLWAFSSRLRFSAENPLLLRFLSRTVLNVQCLWSDFVIIRHSNRSSYLLSYLLTHPGTSRAWRRVTTLIESNVLPLYTKPAAGSLCS